MSKQENKKRAFTPNPNRWRIAAAIALTSGLFSLVVCALLIANYAQIRAADPLDDPQLALLREQLADAPKDNEALVAQIRALDLLSRKAFFTSQAHLRMGGQLLLCGVVVFLSAFRLAARWNSRPPAPESPPDPGAYWQAIARSKELISGIAVILALVALTAAYMTPIEIPALEESVSPLSSLDAEEQPTAEPAEVFPTWEELQQQWPSFRGPGGFGVAHYTTAPMAWDGETGANIRWQSEVPLLGFNSPVVWDNRVLLSGATEAAREIYCFDADTGALVWQHTLVPFPGTPEEPPDVTSDTGYAAPTMAVHGHRAFAMFATGDLACVDLDGNPLWGRNVGVPDNHYGHSSSLIAFDDKLFVQFDDKREPRVMALYAATGEQAWTTPRTKISWASPACIPTPFGFELVLASEADVDAYDPVSGALLWSQKALAGEVAPSPTYSGDTVFVANEYAMATAVRLTDSGGAVASEIAWQWDEALPEVASPTSSDAHFYMATSMGDIVCLSVAAGELVWLQEFDEGFYSSPIRVGDRVYATDLEGTTHIFGTGDAFELLGTPKLSEPVFSTPAFLDGRIYFRTETALICVEDHE